MESTKLTRKLATILAADCVDFSKLMDVNEELTLQNIKACRSLIDPIIKEHGGRIFHTAGDSVIAEFNSVVESVNAAIEFQKILSDRNDNLTEESQMIFRVGIHLDDVIIEGDNIYGSGVNVAARLEGLCKPGCILLSRTVHEKIVKRISIAIDNLGNAKLKNIEGDYEIYQISPILKDSTASGEQDPHGVSPADIRVEKSIKDGDIKPRLMLLPFRNLNKSEDNDFLVDGIVDDIITELSMINSIEIMSRNTTFDYKDNPIDVIEAAEKYKLDYVITGSIRSAGNRVRISAELGDPVSGDSIWSERYDRTMDDVFEIQDEIVSKMANTVLSEIEVTSLKRAKRKPTNKMTSYEYLLQGKFHKRKLTKDDANIAVDMFTNAIESDPSNGRAYAERCCTWADGIGHSWFDESDDDLHKKIRTTLEDAYELTDHDWDCHRLLCNISLHLDLNYDKAEEHGKKAYELNPNNPTVLASYGKSLVQNGKCEKGVELLRKAQELDPLSQQLIDDFIWGSYNLGDYDACIELSGKIRKIRPNTWLLKIASFGALNRQEERDQEISQFIEFHGKDELS
ncbi:MAG: adenylate/guanylate cyclase domain-containing protein, partial [Pseudomonadota bacterium]|nr:adenylate/guanylate cyclase domain-containing protein [Pseudomonadota bacterium]